MADLVHLHPAGLHNPRGYSHAVVSAGPVVHIAGQVALGCDGVLVGQGDLAAQAEQALRNLGLALAAAGASFGSLTSLTIYIAASVPHADVGALREPLRRRIGQGAAPAITLLFVHSLMESDWLIEAQATGVAGEAFAFSAV